LAMAMIVQALGFPRAINDFPSQNCSSRESPSFQHGFDNEFGEYIPYDNEAPRICRS
jgi:hypothetical protein